MDQPPRTKPIPPDHQLPETGQTPTRRKKYWVWILLIVIAVFLYWIFVRHGQNAQPPTTTTSGGRRSFGGPVPVVVATAQKGDIGIYLEAIGTVTAVYTDSITAQVTGVITAVHYKEGQFVHKGDPLVDIDPRPYEAQVTQAEGALERDQNLLAQAQMDLKRYQDAWAKNAIQRQTLEDQEKIVLQDQGTVKNDQGTLRYDQVQLAYCHITAPIEGRVGLRLVDPGNLVTANATTSLVVITQMQPITVVATISEDNLSEIFSQPDHGLNLPLEAWDRASTKKLATGKITSYDNQIDTTTGTIKLRALFDNKHGELYPNEFVNTRLQVKILHDQILLPGSAIQHNGTTAFVYVIQNSQAQMRTVKTGVSDNGQTAVQGVNQGEVIADSSFEKLQNGSKVTITQQSLPTTSDEANTP
ncbi:MAG TPA: efflux RND transporter periplasmic adaptor subunit [Verrucomicrobiae bacterium]|jgi:membrane fusion protein, multidrug efflux system|nr:efflux RND transporter periplasmic adaptor subunit [Verrucomicrobiae bacterium]